MSTHREAAAKSKQTSSNGPHTNNSPLYFHRVHRRTSTVWNTMYWHVAVVSCLSCYIPFLSDYKKAYLPAGSFCDYLTSLGLVWQPAQEGWGGRGDARRRRRVELAMDEDLRSVCVCVYFLCIWLWMFKKHECVKIHQEHASLSRFPSLRSGSQAPFLSLFWLGMLWQSIRLYGSVNNMLDPHSRPVSPTAAASHLLEDNRTNNYQLVKRKARLSKQRMHPWIPSLWWK